jgi:hypothetical protein
MTAPNPTPVISNIYWEIFAETNLNDRIQKSRSAATDPFQPVMAFSPKVRSAARRRHHNV